MEKEKIAKLLKSVAQKKTSVNQALKRLRRLPYEDLDFAKIDHHRHIRTGFPEVVFCQGKTDPQIITIFKKLVPANKTVLLTRCPQRVYSKIKKFNRTVKYHPLARIVVFEKKGAAKKGFVSVLCAGTSDIPVAEEAAITAESFGSRVVRNYDVGVAGAHRIFDCIDQISKSNCIVAVAGMEGALASVVGGLASCPVVAVPTSVGYGANFKGVAPLLTMLNCCAPGVSVVNIDNGFGAGYLAALINRMSFSQTHKEQA